ncbi:Remorin, C-terminal [Artemisia annua]|uniref:Remorin, C-terminal n=1 Tax=Artemisia annua TaxID=35608 RepID=A0A2U1QB25_ARTAN|nr:Remorin, C-terminal [Artemisia annua]
MRSVEDKSCLNHVSTLESRHRTALGKPTPSKWDDAQKWLVKLSRGGDKSHSSNEPRKSNADNRRLIAQAPKRDYSSSEDGETCDGIIVHYEGIETKNVDYDDTMVRSICVRDMGTEMTPIASQEPSRTSTPVRATTPAARSPIGSGSSTPVRSLTNGGHNVEVGGTTRFGRQRVEVTGENMGENKMVDQDRKTNPLETRAMAWDEAERAKYMARYKREEVKIQAWENHEKRKAEMEMKRLEAKAERLKSRAQEKYTNKLASTRRIAEEKRAKAEVNLNEKAVKTSEKADYIRRTGHLPSSFSVRLPSSSCAFRSLCYSCHS